ncbi:MAG: GTPase Era [Chloroflexota bacterium]|nr:GTPase Era [Chloroflexota bacterium]
MRDGFSDGFLVQSHGTPLVLLREKIITRAFAWSAHRVCISVHLAYTGSSQPGDRATRRSVSCLTDRRARSNLEPHESSSTHKSGFVAIVGKPNVGKSTLVNEYVGAKIAIVSNKPQTTRRVIRGILSRADAQVIFVDTPGIHKPLHRLGSVMVDAATRVINEVDVVVFLVDGSRMPTEEDARIGRLLNERCRVPVLLALNKMDLLKPQNVQAATEAHWALVHHADWMRLSATRGDNRDKLLEQILARLPAGPELYPADQVTDQNIQVLAAELIREQVLQRTRQEIPHSVAVAIEQWEARRADLTHISATIYVERESQKAIVIGAGGAMLKEIGQTARAEIEPWVGHQVYLELWVKVWEKWRERENSLRDLGFTAE